MSDFLLFLLAVFGLLAFLLVLAGISWCVGAWQMRREAAARQQAAWRSRHPSRRPLRRRCPGLPVDGEPLTETELNEFTGIMMTPPTGIEQAWETPADEDAE